MWGQKAWGRDRDQWRAVISMIVILGPLLAVSVSASADSTYTYNNGGNDPTGWRELIIHDRNQLFAGSMFYTQLGSADVQQSVTFTVTVKGSRVPIDPVISRPLKLMPVLVGGTVGVNLTCLGATCTPETITQYPIVSATDSNSWQWSVEADKPGTAVVVLNITTYEANTTTALANRTIGQSISIIASPSYTIGKTAGFLNQTLLETAAVLGGLGISILAALRWLRKKWTQKRKKLSLVQETEEDSQAGNDRPTPPRYPDGDNKAQQKSARISEHNQGGNASQDSSEREVSVPPRHVSRRFSGPPQVKRTRKRKGGS